MAIFLSQWPGLLTQDAISESSELGCTQTPAGSCLTKLIIPYWVIAPRAPSSRIRMWMRPSQVALTFTLSLCNSPWVGAGRKIPHAKVQSAKVGFKLTTSRFIVHDHNPGTITTRPLGTGSLHDGVVVMVMDYEPLCGANKYYSSPSL